MNAQPPLSIIIPTHNRSDLLLENLDALSYQSCPEFKVIVAADTCRDDTTQRVLDFSLKAPFPLDLVSHDARSAAATRNLGARYAKSDFLLFLDDDIIAGPDLVRAHLLAQYEQPNSVVLGYSQPVLPPDARWWQHDAECWWEEAYHHMRQPGYRFTYRDFFSGNVSMPARLFHRVGGYDAALSRRLEDYELGLRLLRAGASFRFEPQALGLHYDYTHLHQWLRYLRQEGVAEVQMQQRYPELGDQPAESRDRECQRARWLRKMTFSTALWGE